MARPVGVYYKRKFVGGSVDGWLLWRGLLFSFYGCQINGSVIFKDVTVRWSVGDIMLDDICW